MAEGEKVTEPPSSEAGGPPGGLISLELPSFSDACALVDSPYSCLVVETHRRHLAMSPKYLNKKRTGIQEQLNTELLKYNDGLAGVPVAYDNIKLVSELGDIFDDLGHIHLNIEADFVIFQPSRGQILVGVVNKVAPSHIGCLVHGCFNASIPKPFKMAIEAWQHLGVNIGDCIEFEVFRLDSDAVGVFCIRGRLDPRMEALAIERLNDANANQDAGDASDQKEDVSADGSSELVSVENQEKTKKKSKKRKYQETDLGTQDISEDCSTLEESSLETSTQQIEETPRKEKKKKKRHDTVVENSVLVDEAAPVTDTSTLELDGETSAPISQEKRTKKKSKKSRQGNSEADFVQSGLSEDASFTESSTLEELVKIKKKHKKHKNSSFEEDLDKNISNGAVSVECHDEHIAESVEVSQDVPKKSKHKKKHREHLSDTCDYQVDSINGEEKGELLDVSVTQSEPKPKKRKE
ncbi:DNA-directed RNA polymerase I subunit RPA43 [Spea bombifrons]|uniref:DNA-directed RNA polymerase I subunit RPA43 n=1 Tax=Spea bombifrons TaxID=233779 RepID=UPI00234A3EA4|nr:DNA-directed RNA polymerase I subunit RPA43 [Spea bombifrons]